MHELLIANVEVEGRSGLDVLIRAGRVAEIGTQLKSRGERIDAKGGALLPGLVDHHLHLRALAAQRQSLAFDGTANPTLFHARISAAVRELADGAWLRITGYHETTCGPLARADLDTLAPDNPVRVQHQSGATWLLNSKALSQVIGPDAPPAWLERDASGELSGVVWRGDAWLSERIGRTAHSLAQISQALSSFGITAVTDASVSTDAHAIADFVEQKRAGALHQKLCLMSGDHIAEAEQGEYRLGPMKIMLDESALPPFESIVDRIAQARRWQRNVAFHCATAGELAFTLAALAAAGPLPGDRVEHGGIIDDDALAQIAHQDLTVVTQPAFIHAHGDRYLRDVEPQERPWLYRAASLLRAGVRLAASSDAPYATPDPWVGMRAAVERRTRLGEIVGSNERLSPGKALRLYLSPVSDPGGTAKTIREGMAADLCLLRTPLAIALRELAAENVAATLIEGEIAYRAA